jgi:hypothetical protein
MKSKCPSWRRKAPVGPRRQGHRSVAFTGAKRKSLTEDADDQAQGLARKGRSGFVEVPINRTVKVSEAMAVEISGSIHPTDCGIVP